MWQILHASFWKFSKLSYNGISLNWPIIDEITTRNTTAYFLAHSVYGNETRGSCNPMAPGMQLMLAVCGTMFIKFWGNVGNPSQLPAEEHHCT